MSDFLLTYAAHLDREPVCRCCQTDRGVDTLGCDRHDTTAAARVPEGEGE
jgi:hypothetical protein